MTERKRHSEGGYMHTHERGREDDGKDMEWMRKKKEGASMDFTRTFV